MKNHEDVVKVAVPTVARVLVVDDDDAVLRSLQRLLEQDGHEATFAQSGEAALTVLGRHWYDVVLADVRMPVIGGFELLSACKERYPDLPVLLMTSHAGVSVAIEAMRRGADDFICKPFEREELQAAIQRALSKIALRDDVPAQSAADGEFVPPRSTAMKRCLELVDRAARSGARVLIRGESGTGKELVARRLHERGPRSSGPFVAVNCAAIPESLLESELFGHSAGAFTGAVRDKPGRLELAKGGTLFLDEIGDLAPPLQAKLLRLIESGTYERIGDVGTRSSDARIVAATHRDLEAMVRLGEFREDLFYRLDVLTIGVPPLRERPDDIEALARGLLREIGGPQHELDASAIDALRREPWPGNVRQLRNVIERLVVFSDGQHLEAEDVRRHLRPGQAFTSMEERAAQNESPGALSSDPTRRAESLRDALRRSSGNRTQAARLLGVSRRTFYRWMEEHDVEAFSSGRATSSEDPGQAP